uniref:NECAP PHear domain-containing protein n=1 Tax=Globodera rostochiensis TaxID=31243 RepID=A0A914HG23_GLORO
MGGSAELGRKGLWPIIPPLTGNKGYKASDWKLDSPDWTGRLRLISTSNKLEIRLEDKNSGELYAKAPVGQLNSVDYEPVTDSSRYFVVRLRNDNGKTAFVGLGFADRADSFDLNVAIQDHFKTIKKCDESMGEELQNEPKLDLSFKEGQTITVNIGKKTITSNNAVPNHRTTHGNNIDAPVPFLPPPPASGNKIRK